jgi:Ca-activated chloride channel homolog
MIQLDWPLVLLLLPLPLLAWWLLPRAPARGAIELPIGKEFRALSSSSIAGARRIALAALAAWTLLVLAGAQPRWTGEPVALPVQARDLLLAVDVSGSMSEKDVDPTDQGVSRLEAVIRVAGDFIERREGDRIGLILFGTNAYLHVPLSLDRKTVATLLADAEVGIAGRGTAIGDAIALAVAHLRESSSRQRVLVLLTDGENTAGSVPPETAAGLAAQNGIRIHTIGFGADYAHSDIHEYIGVERPRVDEAPLQRIAGYTGGRFFRAHNTPELADIYRLLDQIEPADVGARTFRPTRSLAHWPLALAALLTLVLVVRRQVLQ